MTGRCECDILKAVNRLTYPWKRLVCSGPGGAAIGEGAVFPQRGRFRRTGGSQRKGADGMAERLDKILSSQGAATRREAQRLIRSGKVTVDGTVQRDPSVKVDPETCEIVHSGRTLLYRRHLYVMLNKPAGLLCVSRDPQAATVIDLLPQDLRRQGLFPAGRLDKDTVGLVIITDDGDFAHRMLAPKKEIVKRYRAVVDGPVGEEEAAVFAAGTSLKDGTRCRPAKLRIVEPGNHPLVEVEITEGRYHQIKRMFLSVNRRVLWLKRMSIGKLLLDPALKEGECREIGPEERSAVFQ